MNFAQLMMNSKPFITARTVFVFGSLKLEPERNTFMDATAGMDKDARVSYYAAHF
jgi:hypothetical protein